MKKTLVSVNIPVYNAEKYIKETIESILTQTLQDFEIIIINDASTDNTVQVIKSIKDTRIKLFHNNQNKGIAETRNIAIQKSSGKYIALLDADDIALPTRLEKQVNFLESHPDFKMIGSWVISIDENGKELDITKFQLPANKIKTMLFFQNVFAQSAIMIRKSILKEFKYDLDYSSAEDYHLWIRIAQKYKVWNLQEPLVKYRIHNNSITQTQRESGSLNNKKVISFKLQQLGISGTSEEIGLHLSLVFKSYIIEKNYISLLIQYFEKIFKANIEYKLYDSKQLKKFISKYLQPLLNSYFVRKQYNFTVLNELLDKKSKFFLFFNKYLLIKLIIKCLLHHKAK